MKKRMMIGSRMYKLAQEYVFDDEGKRMALRDAQAWRDRGYWAVVRKGKDATAFRDYPAVYVGQVWAVYRSFKKKGR